MKNKAEQFLEKFIQSIVELEINNPKLTNLPIAIGINCNDVEEYGIFTVNSGNDDNIQNDEQIEYGFSLPEIYFPVLGINILNNKMTFNCCYPNSNKIKDTLQFDVASKMLQSITEVNEIEIAIDGETYHIDGFDCDEISWNPLKICAEYGDNRQYICFSYVKTFPVVDISYSEWANDQAYKAWKKEQNDIKHTYQDYDEIFDECDGGGCVGGDAGGGAVGGDVGGAAVGDVGDAAGEMAGTSTAEVLGTNEPGKGFFGKDNFYIPARARFPISRFEIANGGSKRKKNKKGKPKKTPYEKNMKVVVNMFESEDIKNIDKKKIRKQLKELASKIKDIEDAKEISKKFESDEGSIALERFSNSKYRKSRHLLVEMGNFLKYACTGKYSISWFAISMIAVAIAYVISQDDFIPDGIPVVNIAEDALVLNLVYEAVKDEFEKWKSLKLGII